MRADLVKALPAEAFSRGVTVLPFRHKTRGVLILGFDTEYDAKTQEIICYQLSDGHCSLCDSLICKEPLNQAHADATRAELVERQVDFTWSELSQWVISCLDKWGYSRRDVSTIMLVSHFSTAELSHVQDFWEEAEVRRVSAAQVYNATYRIDQRTRLVVMDNYHFWNVGNNGSASLFAVAAKFGERKVELPPDLPIKKACRAYLQRPEFRFYAIWDAVLCARVFHKFRERLWADYEIDLIQYPTSASLAMAVYRRHFLGADAQAPDSAVRKQAWLSLWGGRAEAYRQGDFTGGWTLRDVTSLYPSAEKLLGILPRAEDWISRLSPQSWRGLCRVKFRFPAQIAYPVLPVCHDKKLIFPRSGVSDCTLDEAKLARDLGAELEWLSVWEYDSGDTTLTDFMAYFMEEKERLSEYGAMDGDQWRPCAHQGECECAMKDEVGREIDKLMMNSLIGKLSQNKGDVDVEEMKRFAEKERIPLAVAMSPSFLHPEKPASRFRIGGYIMPEWSALILGKARAIMGALLNHVGVSLICSTDSMLVPDHLNDLVDEAMKAQGVVLTNKNKGKQTRLVRVVRNRVYAATSTKDEIVFGASHAIHLGSKNRDCEECEAGKCKDPKHNALRFILSDASEYVKIKRMGLKTAIRSGERFFSEEPAKMEFSRAWDDKRRLLASGGSEPWDSIEEYDATVAARRTIPVQKSIRQRQA